MSECVVYHKHLAGMDLTEGYIGISKNFEERMKQHDRDAFVRRSEYTVHRMMRLHADNVITSIISEGTIKECFEFEEVERPRWHMGWNMAIGGGRIGSGWKPNPKWMHHSIWHKDHGTEVMSEHNNLNDLSKRYGYSHAGFSDILLGKRPENKGWELEDKQLAMRIDDRYRRPWTHEYFKKDKEVVSIHRGAESQFRKHFNIERSILKDIIAGAKVRRNGWELATEEEWLATAERVEFK